MLLIFVGDCTAVIGSLSESDTWIAKKLTVEHNSDNQKEVNNQSYRLSIYLSIYVSIYVSIYLYIYLSIYLSIAKKLTVELG